MLAPEDERDTRRRLQLRGGPLPARVRADVRPLLPLPELPAADRERVRDQPADRGRPGRAARGRAAGGRGAARRRQHATDLPLSDLPGGGLQRVRAARGAVRPRRHARRSVERRAGRAHLHPVEARLGHGCPSRCRRSRSTTTRASCGRRRASSGATPPSGLPSGPAARPGRSRTRRAAGGRRRRCSGSTSST